MKLLTSYLGKTVLAPGAIVLAVAGCASGSGGEGSGADDSGSSSGLVSVASVDGTDVLVDAEGHTLYTAEVEKGGRIRCVDACTSFWQPMTGSAADVNAASSGLRSELGLVDRPEGESQLTYEGLPLYTFAAEGAGELKGDGFTDDFRGAHFEWSAAKTDESTRPSGTPGTEAPADQGDGYGY